MPSQEQKVTRALAWLIRNEHVSAEAVERAVNSAVDMKIGEAVALTGDTDETMRRAFVQQEAKRLLS
jgi:hypothetical protein